MVFGVGGLPRGSGWPDAWVCVCGRLSGRYAAFASLPEVSPLCRWACQDTTWVLGSMHLWCGWARRLPCGPCRIWGGGWIQGALHEVQDDAH